MTCDLIYTYVQWNPVYPDALGPGCVQNSGFSKFSSQASYTCNYAISTYNEIQANNLPSV